MNINFKKFNLSEPKKTVEIRAALKAYLSLNGLTQKDYAKKKGVSESFLCRVINSKGSSLPLLMKIKGDVKPLWTSIKR